MAALSVLSNVQSWTFELFSCMWSEIVIFALAAIVYALFTGKRLSILDEFINRANGIAPWSPQRHQREGSARTNALSAKTKQLKHLSHRTAGCDGFSPTSGFPRGGGPDRRAAAPAAPKKQADADQRRPSADGAAPVEISMSQAKVISNLGKDGNLPGAVRAFERLQSSGAQMTSYTYNCFLDACVQCDNFKLASTYFKEVKSAGLADVVTYNTMIKGRLSQEHLKAAEALLAEMIEAGVKPNQVTYHGFMHASLRNGNLPGMWRMLRIMQADNLKPNTVTCSILLKGVTSPSDWSDVLHITELIDGMDTDLDEVLFACLVEACIRTGNLELLSQRTRMYAEQGGLAKVTAPIYGSMIKAYGQAHDVDRLWELWRAMHANGVRPTCITIGCTVEALVTNNQTESAWDLVQKVWADESQRAFVNTITYTSLLKGFALARKPARLFAVYEEMRERKIPCNTIAYNTILNAMARCGLMERVPEILHDMKHVQPTVVPDIVTYSTIVKGYCAAGELEKSLQLVESLEQDAHVQPDEVIYNCLLDGYAKHHRLDDALILFEKMKAGGVQPSNHTLSILTKLLGRARRLNQAISMVESVSKQCGFQLNIQVYTCLIQACFHNRQPGRALTLYDNMVSGATLAKDKGTLPDEKLYTVLAQGFMQCGQTAKAVEVVRCSFHLPGHGLRQVGDRPASVTKKCLVDLFEVLGEHSPLRQQLVDDLKVHRCLNVSADFRYIA